MTKRPRYVELERYVEKLERVMKRLGVSNYQHECDAQGGSIDFVYKNERYRFEHSIGKARERDIDLQNGEAAFSQLVLALEDLARLAERGIYDLQSWIEGMKLLPAPKSGTTS